jgi:biopolymer transport protein ExbD
MLYRSGIYRIESSQVAEIDLEKVLLNKYEDSAKNADFTVTIVAEKGTPFEKVVRILTLAEKMKVKAILATQPKKLSSNGH